MALTIIPMAIDMKAIGILIFRMEWELIIIPITIYTRESGLMENQMEKGITFIMEIRVSIKGIGRMERSRDLDN
jgi:hypothetical protein